ncbi:hypothetical protein [Parasulfitobacter algicola]|uniref:Uncharacterized protein n=1 Tax=Parasulfitobacter algicola TaxID=2614809 RepID=A0ABX2IQE6_9RHOB|nr:hypothetical protein [Sulfitobacter algicola]NSX55109.1 hypothetical protein [Sulfitobacter algicola]
MVWIFVSINLGKLNALITGLGLYILLLAALYAALPYVNVHAISGLFVLAGMTNRPISKFHGRFTRT